jgi:lipopolysaccharide export system protein LptA
MEITALQFEYYSGDSLMILTGRVLVIDHKNNRTIRASELIYNTDDDSFEGKSVEMEIILEDD